MKFSYLLVFKLSPHSIRSTRRVLATLHTLWRSGRPALWSDSSLASLHIVWVLWHSSKLSIMFKFCTHMLPIMSGDHYKCTQTTTRYGTWQIYDCSTFSIEPLQLAHLLGFLRDGWLVLRLRPRPRLLIVCSLCPFDSVVQPTMSVFSGPEIGREKSRPADISSLNYIAETTYNCVSHSTKIS